MLGGVTEDAGARAAVDALNDGTDLPGAQYAPLVSDPMMGTRIGDTDYNLVYDPGGFSYEDESGDGLELSGADIADAAGDAASYPFDITDPDAVRQALEDFNLLGPADPAYAEYLAALAAAYSAGSLPSDVMDDILTAMDSENLVYYPDTLGWAPSPNVAIANDVVNLLSDGTTWNSLTAEQQTAYANVYLDAAVEAGGATALNLMGPNRITPRSSSSMFWFSANQNGDVMLGELLSD